MDKFVYFTLHSKTKWLHTLKLLIFYITFQYNMATQCLRHLKALLEQMPWKTVFIWRLILRPFSVKFELYQLHSFGRNEFLINFSIFNYFAAMKTSKIVQLA